MVDVSAIAGTVSALKGAMDISKAIVGLHDAQAIQSKVIELNSKIIDAQSSALAANEERATLIQRIRDLEEENIDLKAWGAEKEKYGLAEVGAGAFAYILKPNEQSTEPPHWLCTTCYQHGKKSFLQYNRVMQRWHIYTCNECSGDITVPWMNSPGKPKQEF